MPNNSFIHLIGFAGTGKLTIARELQKLAPFILVDNHFINNVVFSLIEADGVTPLPSGTWDHVGRIRSIVYDVIRDLVKPDRNFIFTNELFEGHPKDREGLDRIADLAQSRKAAFLPVRLLIAPEELARRVISPERARNHKSIDVNNALDKTRTKAVLTPTPHEYLNLDVTDRSAGDAAREIFRYFNLPIARNQQRSGLRP